MILRCYRAATAKHPLSRYREGNRFKIYVLDVGLLGAMTRIDPSAMVQGDRVFRELEGALVENYVATQLKAIQGMDL